MNIITVLHYIAPLIGFFTLAIGISAVLRPGPMSKNFGIKVDGLALPYVVSTGIRDVFMGGAVLILFFLQLWQALGAISLCLGVVAISDFLVVQKHGDKKTSMVHLGGAISTIVYGAVLLAMVGSGNG